MSATSNRARLRWASKKWKFRRRWPVYLVVIILGVTSVALGVIILNNVDEPDNGKKPATSVPKAIG